MYLKHKAEGNPFDNGEFALIEEGINRPLPENDSLHFTSEKIQWPDGWEVEEQPVTSLVSSVG